jgi:hypothetical protein
MTAKCLSPEVPMTAILLIVVALARCYKSQTIFSLTSLFNIAIPEEAYRVHTGPTQCYNCHVLVAIGSTQSSPQDVSVAGVTVAIKIARRRTTKHVHQSAATVRCNIPAVTEGAVAPNTSTNKGSRHPGSQAPTGRSAASTPVAPRRTSAAAAATAAPADNAETPAPKDRVGKAPEPAPNKSSCDGCVVTLIITAQKIMTALKTAETEDEGISVVMTAVYGSLSLCVQHTLPLSTCQTSFLLWEEDPKWRKPTNVCCTSESDKEPRQGSTPRRHASVERPAPMHHEPARITVLLAACFLPVASLAYLRLGRWRQYAPPKRR